ncbi:MAG TPA: hypothetical protein VEJ18_01915 [Planctomycetota bacterium]|nr:hypothetical protein [Planctomycetota bacterium]
MSARAWLRSAYACGALPLSAGVLIFLLWLPTRWGRLELLGLLTLLGGGFLFVVGIVSVVIYVNVARRETPGAPVGRNALMAAGLLCLNLPVAGAIVIAAFHLKTRVTIDVVNDSGRALTAVVLSGGGFRLEAGDLPPGGRLRRHVRFASEGNVSFEARQQGRTLRAADGYFSDGIGGHARILVTDGAARIDILR